MTVKKFLSSILITCMIVGLLSGCGSNTENTSSKANNLPKASKDNFNTEGLPILNEPEEFTFIVQQMSTTHPAAEKPIVKEVEEATNIKINWIEIPMSSWREKTNIIFASGDLPDAFASGLDTSLYYEQFVELDDLIDQYAPNVQKILEDPRYAQGLKAPDGKIHQLPGGDESFNNQMDKTLWINQT